MADEAYPVAAGPFAGPMTLGDRAAWYAGNPSVPYTGDHSANAAEAQEANRNPRRSRMPKPEPEESGNYPGF